MHSDYLESMECLKDRFETEKLIEKRKRAQIEIDLLKRLIKVISEDIDKFRSHTNKPLEYGQNYVYDYLMDELKRLEKLWTSYLPELRPS